MIIKSNLASKQPGAVDHSKLGTNKQKSVSSTKSKASKKEIKPIKSTSPIEKTKKALKQANSTKSRQSLDLKSKTVAQTPATTTWIVSAKNAKKPAVVARPSSR